MAIYKKYLPTISIIIAVIFVTPQVAAASVPSLSGDDSIWYSLAAIIFHLFYLLASTFLLMAGWLLDFSIKMALDSSYLTDLKIINDIWATIRDIANVFFIFIFLYIAIATVLRLSGVQWKQALANLIVVALLINFSATFTNLVIDATNILAVGFYNNIKTDIKQPDGSVKPTYGPSSVLLNATNLQTFLTVTKDKNGKPVNITSKQEMFIYLGGSIFSFVTAFVFMAGAFLFIIRFVSFIFLIILSPLAFAAYILSNTRPLATRWWSTLINNALLAPVYLGMMYIVARTVQSNEFQNLFSLSKGTLANEMVHASPKGGYPLIMNFLIVTALIWGALKISQELSSKATSTAMKWGGKTIGLGMTGVALAGRHSVGAVGRAVRESDLVKKTMTRRGVVGSLARGTYTMSDKVARSSFDVRNSKIGGAAFGAMAAGGMNAMNGAKRGKGGYQSFVDEQDKKYQKKQEQIAQSLEKDKYGNTLLSDRIDPAKAEERKRALADAKRRYEERKQGLIQSGATREEVARAAKAFRHEINTIRKDDRYKLSAKDAYAQNVMRERATPKPFFSPKGQAWRIRGIVDGSGYAAADRVRRNKVVMQKISKKKSGSGIDPDDLREIIAEEIRKRDESE